LNDVGGSPLPAKPALYLPALLQRRGVPVGGRVSVGATGKARHLPASPRSQRVLLDRPHTGVPSWPPGGSRRTWSVAVHGS